MISALPLYPTSPAERDAWVFQRRGPRAFVDPEEPYAYLLERERSASGDMVDVATIFLTNRECPWRCAMCDLWQHTLPTSVQPGQLPRQIAYALEKLPPARHIKLYNSGSFFDRGAIPFEDYPAIAALLKPFERVIVECHPALISSCCTEFAERIDGALEIAMGLETAHPAVLDKLNKRMTLDQYAAAANKLRASGIALRSFVLVQPPFMAAEEALFWACRSIDFAQGCSATAVSLIPTRGGSAAVDELARRGEFTPPTLSVLEDALEYGIERNAGRVFLDTWDLERVPGCPVCRPARHERLHRMNQSQTVEPRIACTTCGGAS